MPGFMDLLGGPIKDILGSVRDVIDEFHTSGEEKLEAQRKLVEIERSFQTKVMELDADWAKTQADVIKAEATSESWLTRNWRPITVLWLVVVLSSVVWTGGYINGHAIDEAFQLRLLDIIQFALSGYIVGRSIEKTAPAVTKIITDIKKK